MEMLTKSDFFNEVDDYIKECKDFNNGRIDDLESTIHDFLDGKEYDFQYQVFVLNYYDHILNENMQLQHYTAIEALFQDTLFDIVMEYVSIDDYE